MGREWELVYIGERDVHNSLTYGRTYNVSRYFPTPADGRTHVIKFGINSSALIKNNSGTEVWYDRKNFLSIQEFRDKKLN